MIRTVTCPSCSTAFPVDPRKVPDDGVYARCSTCSSVFFVEGAGAVATEGSARSLDERVSSFAGAGSAGAAFAESVAAVPDAEFSQAFFDIWLSDKTSEPGLKKRLTEKK